MVQATIFKCRLEVRNLFLTLGLEFPENRLGLLALGATEEPVEDGSTRRV